MIGRIVSEVSIAMHWLVKPYCCSNKYTSCSRGAVRHYVFPLLGNDSQRTPDPGGDLLHFSRSRKIVTYGHECCGIWN